jgi:pyruvate dehydrogenase E2 component (dihydrolipoamide acetyltransferase)
MATKVTMPKLGLTMVEGQIVEWMKKEGDRVEKGEILYVLETEKAAFEVEAPEAGILAKIIAKVGDTVPVGGLVAYITQPGEKLEDVLIEGAKVEIKKDIGENLRKEEMTDFFGSDMERQKTAGKIKISPLAKNIARQHGIDLFSIKGTGLDGKIMKEDVLKAIEEKKQPVVAAPFEASEKYTIAPLTTMRKTIARRMSHSFQTAPHFWVVEEVDATELKKVREILTPGIEKQVNIKLNYVDLLIKFISKALAEFPYMNASWTDEGVRLWKEINIGVAVDVPKGLIVPVIPRAGEKSLTEIVAARSDLVNRGREGKLKLEEMAGSTFTINNMGGLGLLYGNSVINPPESCILTTGAIRDRPAVAGGEIVIRPIMTLSLGCDHRVFDGGYSVKFMLRLKELIEQPVLSLD